MSEAERLRETLVDLERARQRERELRLESEALLEGLHALSLAESAEQVFPHLVRILRGVLGFTDAFILVRREDGALEVTASTARVFERTVWRPEAFLTKVLDGRPASVFDVNEVPEWRGQDEACRRGVLSALHVPLKGGGGAALLVCLHPDRGFFGAKHLAIAQRLSPLASEALFHLDVRRDAAAREGTLKQTLALLKATIDATVDGILVADGQGKILMFNQRFARMWGLPQEVLESRDDDRAIAHVLNQLEQPDLFVAKIRELYAEPGAESFDVLKFKDGQVFERYSMPYWIDSKPMGRVWSFRDVTARALSEEALRERTRELEEAMRQLEESQKKALRSEKMAAIGKLSAGVAHELRNPLGTINNAIFYLKEALENNPAFKADAEFAEIMRLAEDEIKDATRIITVLLDFTRVAKLELSATDMSVLLDDICRRLTIPPGVRVSLDKPAELPKVKMDAVQMRQVLKNLMINALQAMPAGGDLKVSAHLEGSSHWAQLVVDVTDTGTGMDETVMARIWEPLFTTKAKGTGLGLCISREIVEHHGGRIDVVSTPGQGTTFTVRLPAPQNS